MPEHTIIVTLLIRYLSTYWTYDISTILQLKSDQCKSSNVWVCTDPDVLWWQWVDTWRVVTQHNVSAWNQSKMGRRRCRKKVSCLMYWKLCMTWLALNTRYYKRQFASFASYLSPTLVQDAAVTRARLRPGLVPAAAGGRGGQPAAAVRREAGLLSRLQRRQPGQQPGQVEQGRVATMNVHRSGWM